MSGNRRHGLHETFGQDDLAPPEPRSTGFVFAAVCALAAVAARHSGWLWPLSALAALFAALATFAPGWLRPLNLLWWRFSLLLNRIVSPLVLGLLFFAVFTPYGYVMRLAGNDPLRLRRRGDETTWWRPRREQGNDMRKQF